MFDLFYTEYVKNGNESDVRGALCWAALLGAGILFCSIGIVLILPSLLSWGFLWWSQTFTFLLIIFVVMLLGVIFCCVSLFRIVKTWEARLRKISNNILRDDEIIAPQRRIAAAFEIERRRIERDLHDGTQQYLVASSMALGEAAMLLDRDALHADGTHLEQGRQLVEKAQEHLDGALKALRATVAGIHPQELSDLGLEKAVCSLATKSPLDVTVRVPNPLPDIPEGVTAAAYFTVSEALTNTAKYAPNARTSIVLAADEDLHVSVVDNGPGGASFRKDHGLAGIAERLEAFGGQMSVISPPGGPTTVRASIPLLLHPGEFGVNVDMSGVNTHITLDSSGRIEYGKE